MSKRKDNFNQAMYEMFGIGKESDTSANAGEVEDEAAEFAGIDPLDYADKSNKPAESTSSSKMFSKEDRKHSNEAQREKPRSTHSTYLAEGTSIEGTLHCDSDVEICGDFKGELTASGKVTLHSNTTSNIQANDLVLVNCNLTGDVVVTKCITIDEGSNITGNISAGDVVCSGVVHGNLDVTDNLTLSSKAKVFGDIKAGSLVVERGGRVTGKMEMSG